jgi:hypothetical protein
MRNTMRAARRARALRYRVLPLSLLALLVSCAGKPTPKAEAVSFEPSPSASIKAGPESYEDQYRLKLPFDLTIANPRSGSLRVESALLSLSVQGMAAPMKVEASISAEDRVIAGGSELALEFVFPVDARELEPSVSGPKGPPRARFSCEALVRLLAEDGKAFDAPARAEGSFLLIRDPLFRITSLKIERDILVTTNLALEIEVENPNDFPLELKSMDYRFFGERKSWSAGAYEGALSLPPRSIRRAKLAFEMNFADRDRRLFDLVAELKTVSYGLFGTARIATGLGFLPEFSVKVDEEGSCQVER